MSKLSHLDDQGRAKMVDVSGKETTSRTAVARGTIQMRRETLTLILEEKIEKGDVFSVARVAGIMAAKKTSEVIPMCHPLNITSVEIELIPQKKSRARRDRSGRPGRRQDGRGDGSYDGRVGGGVDDL